MSDYSKINNKNGFTLVEVMIAISVFLIGILALLRMQTTSIQSNYESILKTEAAFNTSSIMDNFKALTYNDPLIDIGTPAPIVSGRDGTFQTSYTVTQQTVPVPGGPPLSTIGTQSAQTYKQIVVTTVWSAYGVIYDGQPGNPSAITSTLLKF